MSLDQGRALIREAQSIVALTGAGISAESGIPTFRGAVGLWRRFRPEELATPQAFARDPKLVWDWYDWRRGLISAAKPNAGHLALAQLERIAPQFTLITQNVDGLHQRAGSKSVLEVHGSIWTLRCTRCARTWIDRTVPLEGAPLCECGSLARPGVVWFGESLPSSVWVAAENATTSCDLFLVIGTSALVYPAAGLASLAAASGAKIIEINVEPTSVSGRADCSLIGPAGEILPELVS